MKNRFRESVLILALSLLFAGCSEDTHQTSVPAAATNAELTQTILDIFAETDRYERIEHLIAVLRSVTDDQSGGLEEALNALDLPYREDLRILIVTEWAKHDPVAATKWVMDHEHVEFARTIMFDETAYAWARKDPNSLARDMRVNVYSSRGWDAAMLRAMVRGWYDSGEPGLDAFIFDLGRPGDDRQRALSELVRVRVAKEGPDSTIEWVKTLTGDLAFKKYAYNRVAGDIAQVDPQRALAWCEEICDEKIGEDMPTWIASDWAVKHGEDAMNWIINRPDSIPARLGARSAYRKFLMHAPEDAVAWIETTTEEQRQGRVLQGPIVMYINRRSVEKLPLVAIEWSKYVQDEGELYELLILNARRWLRYDKSAAEAWLAESPLTDEMKGYVYGKRRVPKNLKGKPKADRAAGSD